MPKIIYDIIPPKYHQPVKVFWQQNSGKIKLGAVLVLTLTTFALGTIFFTNLVTKQVPNALADSVNLRPNGDQANVGWTTLGTDDASCAGGTACDQVDDNVTQPTAGTTTDFVQTGTGGADQDYREFNMTTTTGVGEVTQIKFWIYSQTVTVNGATADTLSLQPYIGGVYLTAVAVTPAGTYSWTSGTFSGSWSQADLDAMNLKFTRNRLGSGAPSGQDDDIQVATVYAEVTYSPPPKYPKLNQTGYIWENDDEDQVTGDVVDENTQQFAGNTAKTSAKKGERVTLRTQIKNTGADALETTKNLALFYDRNDGLFTKVEDKTAVTSAGNCTDTKWDCTDIYTVTSYASAYDVGLRIAFDLSGNPWMAFYNNPLGKDLLVAKYVGSGGTGCLVSSWTCYNIDTTNDIGSYSSIAFSPSGNAWVSYYNATSPQSLKVANYVGSGGTGCATTEWTCTTVDAPANSVGNYTSIAFDSLGRAWVSYTDNTASALKVANYVGSGGTGCTSTAWTCSVVDDPASGGSGVFSYIAFDSSGNAWISHRDTANTSLKVSQYVGSGGSGCTSTAWTCTIIEDNTDSFGNYYTSIAFDPSGNPWLSYFNETVPDNSLNVAQYVGSGGTGCSSTTAWTCTIVEDTANSVGWYSSIAFSPSGNAWVSYADLSAHTLKLARYVSSGGSGCTSTAWSCSTIDDPANNVGEYTSIAFDLSGNAWISYYNATANTIKIANLKRGGEIGISAGLAGANGDAQNESHADMTTTSDTTNRDDTDCIGGGIWNNGKWFESEEANGVALPAGSGTAQCTEVSFNIDLSQAQQNTTYRFVVASNDSFRKDKGYWRGPVSISQYATLTTEASTTKIYSKDNQAKFANCTDTSWGCDGISTTTSSQYPSIAIHPSGEPWYAFFDNTNTQIKVARYVGSGGAGCSSTAWTCENVKSTAEATGQTLKIIFDARGNAWLTFRDFSTQKLYVAKYVGSGGTGCTSSSWTCTAIDAAPSDAGNNYAYSSIAIDSNGTPWISYRGDGGSLDFNVAYYVDSGGTGCTDTTAWTCINVYTSDDAGYYTGIYVDRSGDIWASFDSFVSASSTNQFWVAQYVGLGGTGCANAAWSCTLVASFTGFGAGASSAMAFDNSNVPWLMYTNFNDATVHRAQYVGSGGTGCSSAAWTCTVMDAVNGWVGNIKFDQGGTAWVSYSVVSTSEKVAKYVGSGGTGCSGSAAWTCVTIVNEGASRNDITIDHTGVPWIAFPTGGAADDAKVAKLHLPSLGTNSRYVMDTVGYSNANADDTAMDSIIAGINERPYQTFVSVNANATDTPSATWIGQSTVAASTQNIKLEVYRFGSTNAWETTATNSTCSANVDCSITNGALAGPNGEYYENSGSCGSSCKVYWRVWQAESASTSTTLKVDSFNGTFGGGTNSVAGTACTNEACSTNVGSGVTIVLKKSGADACSGACTATTTAGGAYSITGITGEAANNVLTIYVGGTAAIDDDATYNAVTVTKINAAGDLTGVNLITSRIIVRHETGISQLTNTDLQGWDKDNDADIKFTSNTVAFVSDNTEELHIWTGKTYAPGGTVTTNSGGATPGGDLHVDTSATVSGTDIYSIGGSVTGEGTINLTAGTFEQRISENKTFGSSSGANNWTFSNLTFSNSHASLARTVSVNAGTGSIIVTGTLQIGKATDAAGANTTLDNETANDRIIDIDGSIDITSKGILLASSSQSFTIAGNWTRNGTFTPGTGTVKFNCTGSCATALIAQSTTFYSVSFLNSPANATKNVKFVDATTLTTSSGGVLTITGFDGTNRVELDSETGGAITWNITHHASATESVVWAGIKNSSCVSSSNIDTTSSVDRTGNGACWQFTSSNTVAISALGTQNSPLTIPSTNQYFGGTFVIARNNGASTSLTNVTVSDTGTADT